MNMAYIRDYYGVPAKRGARIRWTWHRKGEPRNDEGTIAGSCGQYLRVRFDGSTQVLSLHPTWEIEYLERS